MIPFDRTSGAVEESSFLLSLLDTPPFDVDASLWTLEVTMEVIFRREWSVARAVVGSESSPPSLRDKDSAIPPVRSLMQSKVVPYFNAS